MLQSFTGLITIFFVAAFFTLAQGQTPVRVGILVQEMERAQSQALKGLSAGLKELGYQERKNLFFETRNVKGNRAALQPAAGELLAGKVTAIFTTGTSATRAARATSDRPETVDDDGGAGSLVLFGVIAVGLVGGGLLLRRSRRRPVP